ncbi:hypothetical protein ES707_21507 [subsurface metagenome]
MIVKAARDTINAAIRLKRVAFTLGSTLVPIYKPNIAVGKSIATLIKRSIVTIPRYEKAPTLAIPMKTK